MEHFGARFPTNSFHSKYAACIFAGTHNIELNAEIETSYNNLNFK